MEKSPEFILLEKVAIALYKKEFTAYVAWQLPNFSELAKLAKQCGLEISVEQFKGTQDPETKEWLTIGGFRLNIKKIEENGSSTETKSS